MSKKSTEVALGGVAAGLCLAMMFLTALLPFANYALPAFAGMVLIAVLTENGAKTALIVYAAVGVLSLFIVPAKESALLFVFFFGHYPILRAGLQRIRLQPLRFAVKLAVFNGCVVAAYLVVINLLGLTEILEEFGGFGRYSVWVLLALGNAFFVVYDFCVGTINDVYRFWFRPRFLRKMR